MEFGVKIVKYYCQPIDYDDNLGSINHCIFELMRSNLFLLLLLFSFSLLPQGNVNQRDEQGRRHGLWKKFYANGKLRYEGYFNHGVEVDTFKFYFDNGNLWAINYYKKKGVAYSQQYGEGKKLAAEGKYINNKKDSTWNFYNENSNLVAKEEYENGKKHGKCIVFFRNGEKAEIINYKQESREGEWLQFYEDGKPRAKGRYINNMLQGAVIYYNLSGRPRVKGDYVEGLMHGNWYYFNDDMKVEKKEIWIKGLKQKD